MELINTHTHTEYCGHGQGTIEELVAAADKAQVTTLAITEHYPLSQIFDPKAHLSMPWEQLEEYCNTVIAIRKRYPHIEIILGCEFDWLGSYEDRSISQLDLSRFDCVLGSTHFIDGWALDDPAMKVKWEQLGADVIWKRYFEIWCEAVLSDKPFTVMAHPDLPKKFNQYPSYDLAPLYAQAVEAVYESGRMVEVNTSGAYYACREMYPSQAFLTELCRAHVPCTIGTDAHHPDNVTRGLAEGYRLMYESGYREVTVPTIGGDRRNITIE